MSEISEIVERQKEFFKSNQMLNVKFGLKYLNALCRKKTLPPSGRVNIWWR